MFQYGFGNNLMAYHRLIRAICLSLLACKGKKHFYMLFNPRPQSIRVRLKASRGLNRGKDGHDVSIDVFLVWKVCTSQLLRYFVLAYVV